MQREVESMICDRFPAQPALQDDSLSVQLRPACPRDKMGSNFGLELFLECWRCSESVCCSNAEATAVIKVTAQPRSAPRRRPPEPHPDTLTHAANMDVEMFADDILNSVEGEVCFFRALMKARPVGINRYFHAISMKNEIEKGVGREIPIEVIWRKLESCFNLDALEALVRLCFVVISH